MERLSTPTSPPTEREMIDLLRETVRTTLPDDWESGVTKTQRPPGDAVLEVTGPDGRTARLLVEAKSIINTRDVPVISQRLGAAGAGGPAGTMAVARYLSPRAREALAGTGMSYLDATGNLRLATVDPAVFLLREGGDRDPWRTQDRPTSSLRGTPSARVVRALVDLRPPWKMRGLAEGAGTSLGSTSRTVDFLAREALIERDSANAIVDVAWRQLLERWAQDYDLAKRRRVMALIAPRGASSIEDTLRGLGQTYAITGSLAATRWAPYADARLGIVYTPAAEDLRAALDLREAVGSPNVLVIEPDESLVFERMVEEDGLSFAAPSQVAVDLLVGPGRNPEEGLALLRWMEANEAQWRRG